MFTSHAQVKVWLFPAPEYSGTNTILINMVGYIEASPRPLYDDCGSWFIQLHSPTNLRTPLLHGGREQADVFITN